ncbi:uncharacterized protein [Parasteatoda tepidariorum]|uniref:uncharacterized protein n=1 Tax=Parasteatoda tepidariorum TaxID=114398 RepID=UPI001C71DB9A|nr:uncharacterized protein LOC107446223 [Parasteatoda tepidariorum]
MAIPFPKKLKVLDPEILNKNFISIIESDIKRTVPLEGRCAYPSDSFLAELACRVSVESKICPDPLDQGWVLLTTAKNSSDNYFGAAYWNPNDQQVVIAHKGTKNLKDIWTDYEGVLSNKYTSQMSSAASFSNLIVTQLDKLNKKQSVNLSLSITGHSLGGWLAQITAFSTQYLTTKFCEEKGSSFFVKSQKEGYHTHTVVFDCPGCKDMLLKMEDDFDVHAGDKVNLVDLLDVTIYLSAPNLVNTLHSHINVGNLYRVFIEGLPEIRKRWNLLQYTKETHKMKKIRDALFSGKGSSSGRIMKIRDWPLVKGGLGTRIIEKLFNSECNEYEHFHNLANCANDYNPPADGDDYCTIRYQLQNVEEGECSANIFTQAEFDFLKGYGILKNFSMFSLIDDLFTSLHHKTEGVINKDKVEKILDFEIKEGKGRGVIKCSSEDILQKVIMCVKNILLISPSIHMAVNAKLNSFCVFNDAYQKQALHYLQSIEYIELKQATMDLLDDFLKSENCQFLQLMCRVHPVIEMKKIHKFLNESSTNYKTLNIIYLSMKMFLNLQQFFPIYDFVKQLNTKVTVLFVIESDEESWINDKELLINYFRKLFSVLEDKLMLKFILITQRSNDLEYYLEVNLHFYCKMTDDSGVTFVDLTNDSQKRLLKKTIFFQGLFTELGSLITDKTKHLVDEETLSKLINNEMIVIGKRLPDLGDIENYYIERHFYQCKDGKYIQKESKIHVTYDDQIETSILKQDQDILLISETGKEFEKLCTEYENRNIHWVREIDDRYLWHKTRGEKAFLEEYCSSACSDIDGRVVIISSVSGAGKSTVLTKIARKMKIINSSLWVMRINLNDYTGKLANVDFDNDKDQIFKFIVDIAGLKTHLEGELFRHGLNAGKVAFFLDGFDEIVPDYKGNIIELLKTLQDSNTENHLWITTRPHMKNELEVTLKVLSYSLKSLSRDDQVMFIRKYLRNILGHSITENFEYYANKLLDSVLQPVSDENNEFTGIPLHIKMLVEAFQEEFHTSHQLSKKTKSTFSKQLHLTSLYKAFVVSKFRRDLTDKKILDLTKPWSLYKIHFASFIKKYSLLALSALFMKKDLKKFLDEEELTEMKDYKKEVQEGDENWGFISHIVDEKPIFIHYSFSEYFAALFFANNIEKENIKKIFCENIYGHKFHLIDIFFDYMVADERENCDAHIAVLNNEEDKVENLLNNSDSVRYLIDAKDKVGRTALHLAAAFGNFYLVQTLLNHEFRVDAKDQLLGWSPLRYADKDGHWETGELLLRKGANACDMHEAIKSLETYDAEKPKETLLHGAAKKGLVKILETLIESKINLINVVDKDGCTPLHYAADEKVTKLLIKRGADIEAKSVHGETPLHYAVNRDKYEVVEILIKNGANMNAGSSRGYTPLHTAVMNEKYEVVELLIKEGADVEANNSYDVTPLFVAGSKKNAKLLIAKNADINAKSSKSLTPLHYAVIFNKDEVVKLLIKEGADVEARDFRGATPLSVAGSRKIAKLLIAKGADINAKNNVGYTPLHAAVIKGKYEVVELLIKEGADVEAKNSYDVTPLFLASSKKISELLIEKGADINAKNNVGYTPLHDAVIKGNYKVVELLIKEGADVEAKNCDGATPLFFAGSKKISELLIAKGADINAKSRDDCTPLHRSVKITSSAQLYDIDGRVVIISSVSGAGKSTVLTKIARKMKIINSSLWVMRINLNDYTGKLANVDFDNDKDQIFKFIVDIAGLKTHLERELFRHGLNAGKVAFFLDGFDEIVPDYKVNIIELLKTLQDSNTENHLWITTRPHMKNELEVILKVLSYSLKLLSRDDQVMFIRKYLRNILGHSITEKFEYFANKLLDSVLQPVSDENNEFTGIPLHIKMLVEAFQEEFHTSHQLSKKTKSTFSKQLHLTSLYKAFVVSKFRRDLTDKKILDLTKPWSLYKIHFASFIKKYSLLALSALFMKKDLKKFLDEEELTEMKDYKKEVQEGDENWGFISHIVDEKPIFIHYSFSEYFAALFFANNIEKENIKKFFCENIYGHKFHLIDIFFDYMVADDRENCDVHIAVLNNEEDKVEHLLTNSDSVRYLIDAKDKVGRTALHLAAAFGNFYLVQTLLNHEFRVDAKEQLLGWRPLRYADKGGHWETGELLLRKGANACDMHEATKSLETYDAEKPKETLLHEAAKKSLVKILETLIESKINLINVVDKDGCTPLHYAADEKVTKLLIKRGADIEAKSMHGETPLHYAVNHDKYEVVEILIKNGADMNARSSRGYTPLHAAVMNEKYEVVELLIKEGADVEAKNSYDVTPLFVAGSEKIAKLLIAKSADINAKSSKGLTPLHYAVIFKKDEVVKLLIKEGADVEAKDFRGATPLSVAGCRKIAKLLIAKGADINAKNNVGYTPLHDAVIKGNYKVVELLIKEGADVEAKNCEGATPLFFAGSKKISELLIAKGAYINAKSRDDCTPLHRSVKVTSSAQL